MHCGEVEASAGEQIFKGESFCRSVRMQWEIYPLNIQVKILSQFFNTPGTEIAPGSHKIREYLQRDPLFHH